MSIVLAMETEDMRGIGGSFSLSARGTIGAGCSRAKLSALRGLRLRGRLVGGRGCARVGTAIMGAAACGVIVGSLVLGANPACELGVLAPPVSLQQGAGPSVATRWTFERTSASQKPPFFRGGFAAVCSAVGWDLCGPDVG